MNASFERSICGCEVSMALTTPAQNVFQQLLFVHTSWSILENSRRKREAILTNENRRMKFKFVAVYKKAQHQILERALQLPLEEDAPSSPLLDLT